MTKLTTSRVDATITKASLVVIDFNDGNEEDCNRIDDLGVEAEKVCPVSIPILIEASRRFIAGKAKHTHARTGAKDGSKAPPKVQQQQLARGELVAGQEGRLNILGKARGQKKILMCTSLRTH